MLYIYKRYATEAGKRFNGLKKKNHLFRSWLHRSYVLVMGVLGFVGHY